MSPQSGLLLFSKAEIEQTIVARFEEQVQKYPAQLAVKTELQSLTYDALNRAANMVARAILIERGQEEEPIAILLEHGATIIVALLAALKAN